MTELEDAIQEALADLRVARQIVQSRPSEQARLTQAACEQLLDDLLDLLEQTSEHSPAHQTPGEPTALGGLNVT